MLEVGWHTMPAALPVRPISNRCRLKTNKILPLNDSLSSGQVTVVHRHITPRPTSSLLSSVKSSPISLLEELNTGEKCKLSSFVAGGTSVVKPIRQCRYGVFGGEEGSLQPQTRVGLEPPTFHSTVH